MTLRCVVDGLLLQSRWGRDDSELVAYDGDEGFVLEALEALYYEIVSATGEDLLRLEQAHYRLLRRAADFEYSRN